MKNLLAASFLLLLTIITFFPILSHPRSRVTDDSDGLLGVWTMWQVQENLLHGKNLFTGNIFYPHQQTIIFSDTFVSSALFLLPVRYITNEPVVLFTVSLFLGQFASSFFLYLVCVSILRTTSVKKGSEWYIFWLALTASCVFSWSQMHLHYSGHLHVFSLQFVFAGMYCVIQYFSTRSTRWAIAATLCALLQFWQSIFLTYYLIFFTILWFVYTTTWSTVRYHASTALVCAVLFGIGVLPLLSAYHTMYTTYHAVRDIREVIHFSLKFPDIYKQFLSPVLYTIFMVAGTISWRLGIEKREKTLVSIFVFGSVLFFILSLGPALHWGNETVKFSIIGKRVHVPLPYLLLYYGAPGFQAFRTPSRFLPLSAVIGLFASILVFKQSRLQLKQLICLCVLCLLATICTMPPLPVHTVPTRAQYPHYVDVIKNLPQSTVIELPIRDWADPHAKNDVYAMLYSTLHQKNMVNGQSGFFPPEWLQLTAQMKDFPSKKTLQILRDRAVELAVLHKEFYTPEILSRSKESLEIVYEDDQVCILDLTRPKIKV